MPTPDQKQATGDNGGEAITEDVDGSSPHGKAGVGTKSPISVHGLWSVISYLLYGGSWNDVDTKYFDGSFDTRRVMWDTKL